MSGEGGPNLVDVRVGSALGRLRRAAGHNRERLAAVLGVSSKQLRAWEAGAERVRASEIFELTRALGAPVSAVFAGLNAPPEAADEDHGETLGR